MAKIIISKEKYFKNLEIISKKAGSKDKVAVVLKDNAYGHGILEIAQLAKSFGITKAVVKNTKEATIIKDFFKEILILADTSLITYSHSFHITINALKDIEELPENTKVQLKIDTGMHRNGISINELEVAINRICRRNLVLTGVFTHHKSADTLDTNFFFQRRIFGLIKKEVITLCEKLLISIPKFHQANSSALFRFKNFDDDLVRVGIAQYGYLETNPIFKNPKLEPILSLWAKKLSQRVLKKDSCVGYGGTYCAKEDMDIGNYDLGYGDGFLRLNEKQTYFTKDGFRVLGRVSMDNLSLNTTKDEVCIFNDAKALAKIHNTISYEIITTLSPLIEREIV